MCNIVLQPGHPLPFLPESCLEPSGFPMPSYWWGLPSCSAIFLHCILIIIGKFLLVIIDIVNLIHSINMGHQNIADLNPAAIWLFFSLNLSD
jgi:uncharacterized membrane protein